MYKRNKDNEKAIAAWEKYLDLNCKLKDPDARKRVGEEMAGIGGKVKDCGAAPKETPKKTPTKTPAKTPAKTK